MVKAVDERAGIRLQSIEEMLQTLIRNSVCPAEDRTAVRTREHSAPSDLFMECSQIAIGALYVVAAQNFTATQRNSRLRCSSKTTPKFCCASDLFPTRQATYSLQIQHIARGTHLPRHRCHSSQADDHNTTPEPSTSGRPLPSVSRHQVFQNCCAVSAALAAAGAGIRAVAPVVSAGLFKTEAAAVQALLQSEYTYYNNQIEHDLYPKQHILLLMHGQMTCVPLPLVGSEDYTHQLVTLATASIVTGARLALLAIWSDFAEASDTSNQQVHAIKLGVHESQYGVPCTAS